MKILLIGKTGQIGYELARGLHGFGDVIAPPRPEMDLSNLRQVREVVRTVSPDMVINAAAFTNVDAAEVQQELAMCINAHAPEVIAEEARKLGALVIHYSSDYVFDGTKANYYDESDACNPVNFYGATKLAAERSIQASGARHWILRTGWVYGARRKNFLTTIRQLAKQKKVVEVVNDQFGTPTWCRTLASVTFDLIKKAESAKLAPLHEWHGQSDIFHVSGKAKVSRYEFAREILHLTDLPAGQRILPIQTSQLAAGARRPSNSALCCKKLENIGLVIPDWQSALGNCLS